MGELSRPEMFAERVGCAELAAKVRAAGGCAYCVHRVEGWNRVACDQPHRTFPRCLLVPGLSFEPDHVKLQGVICTSENC